MSHSTLSKDHHSRSKHVLDVALLFLRLGLTAFGGPAAHIAIMHDEVVKRRKWLDDQHFLDLLGAVQLIPGPNSTEMAIHTGYVRAGWRGLLAGGFCFLIPATIMVMAMAWAYVEYGSTPQINGILYGIKPVIIAIILQALWDLGRKALRTPLLLVTGVTVLVLYFGGFNEILLLFAGGLVVMLIRNYKNTGLTASKSWIGPMGLFCIPSVISTVPFSMSLLFLTFLKIGAVLYGSGYVLLAFLRADLVLRFEWLTDQQLLDAIAVGQVTPGPLFTSATFIGYILGGFWGGILATLGIFLPSFIYVAISNPFIPRLRKSPWTAALLDGVNAASIGLMAAVTVQLGQASLMDMNTIIIAGAAAVVLFKYRMNSTWLVGAGALVGWISKAIG